MLIRHSTAALTLAAVTTSAFSLPTTAQPKNPAIPAAVLSCAANPACRWAVVTIGGILYWQLTRGGDPVLLPVPLGIDPYDLDDPAILGDPEGEPGEWNTSVLANSPEEAERKCRNIAHNSEFGTRLVRVVRRSRNGKTYDCYFEFTP